MYFDVTINDGFVFSKSYDYFAIFFYSIIVKVPLAIYLTKNKNTILLIIKSFKFVKTFKKRNKIGLSARITI